MQDKHREMDLELRVIEASPTQFLWSAESSKPLWQKHKNEPTVLKQSPFLHTPLWHSSTSEAQAVMGLHSSLCGRYPKPSPVICIKSSFPCGGLKNGPHVLKVTMHGGHVCPCNVIHTVHEPPPHTHNNISCRNPDFPYSPTQSLLCDSWKPGLHTQLYDPTVFLHVPFPHGCLSHSSTSVMKPWALLLQLPLPGTPCWPVKLAHSE